MKLFETEKKESFESRIKRHLFNFFPAYRRTGASIKFISADWKEIHVQLALNWKTRNYVGTIFGGSIYGAIDPIFMMQLIKILGPDYVVWDKAAEIKFLKPIRKRVSARFIITDELIEEIKEKVRTDKKYNKTIPVNFQDKAGIVYAEINKLMYIADKTYYANRPAK